MFLRFYKIINCFVKIKHKMVTHQLIVLNDRFLDSGLRGDRLFKYQLKRDRE
jgi:hypothetical protein